MTNASVTLEQTGIAGAINDGDGRWESARNKMFALDFATQAQQMKAIGGQLDKLRTYPSLGEGPMAIWSTCHRLGHTGAGSRGPRAWAC